MTETKEYRCLICDETFNSSQKFTSHLKKIHNLTRKEYYDSYIDVGSHKCPYCDNDRKWYPGNNTYRKTCGSKECMQKNLKQKIFEKYGVYNISQVNEIKLKKEQTCLEHYGCKNPSQSKEIQQKKEDTCIEHYGVSHPLQSEQVLNKLKQTSLKEYGCEYPNQSDKVRNKIRNTCNERYGYDSPFQSDEVKDKIKQTCMNHFGVEYPCQSQIVKQKIVETCLKRYGMSNGGGTDESIRKIKDTKLTRYGNENYCNSDKIQDTFIEKYGCHPMHIDSIKHKIVETNREKYGCDYYTQSIEYHKNKHHNYHSKKYPELSFDSKWEVYVYEFCKDNGIDVEYSPSISYNYEYDGMTYTYHPDFLINGKLYEVKGDQFFRINESGNEEMFCPYGRKKYGEEKWKWLCGKFEAKHQCMIANDVMILRDTHISNLSTSMFNTPTH